MHEAVKQGINFFDVSPYYGRTKAESVLGRALRELPRNEFVLGTKVGRYDSGTFDFSADRVTKSIEESMQRLNVDYLDLVQCHDIEFGDLDQIALETIPALIRLKEAGKIRAIGITGYPLEIFPYVLAATPPKSIDVVLSYCNLTLQNQRLNNIAAGLKSTFGVGVINASPLSMGLLTDGGCPDWHPASDSVKDAATRAAAVCKSLDAKPSLAGTALRFAMNAGSDYVCSTLVGIESRSRLMGNIEAVEIPQDTHLCNEIQKVFGSTLNETWDSGGVKGKPGFSPTRARTSDEGP